MFNGRNQFNRPDKLAKGQSRSDRLVIASYWNVRHKLSCTDCRVLFFKKYFSLWEIEHTRWTTAHCSKTAHLRRVQLTLTSHEWLEQFVHQRWTALPYECGRTSVYVCLVFAVLCWLADLLGCMHISSAQCPYAAVVPQVRDWLCESQMCACKFSRKNVEYRCGTVASWHKSRCCGTIIVSLPMLCFCMATLLSLVDCVLFTLSVWFYNFPAGKYAVRMCEKFASTKKIRRIQWQVRHWRAKNQPLKTFWDAQVCYQI